MVIMVNMINNDNYDRDRSDNDDTSMVIMITADQQKTSRIVTMTMDRYGQ